MSQTFPKFVQSCSAWMLSLSIMIVSCGTKTYSKRGPRFDQCCVRVKDTEMCAYFSFSTIRLWFCLLLTKGRTRSFPVLAVMRRIYGIAYRTYLYLVFRWVLRRLITAIVDHVFTMLNVTRPSVCSVFCVFATAIRVIKRTTPCITALVSVHHFVIK